MAKEPRSTETLSIDDLLSGAPSRVRESYQDAEDALEGAALIRTMRTMARLSKSDLARKLDVKPARITALEKGAGRQGPSYALLKRVARACDLELDLENALTRRGAELSAQQAAPAGATVRVELPPLQNFTYRMGKSQSMLVTVIDKRSAVSRKHKTRPTKDREGTVKWYDPHRGYGFIEPANESKEVLFHVEPALHSRGDVLKSGQHVLFRLEKSGPGRAKGAPKLHRR